MDLKGFSYFGEAGLLTGEPRSASILAKSDCILGYFEKFDFKNLFGGKLHKLNYPLQILRENL